MFWSALIFRSPIRSFKLGTLVSKRAGYLNNLTGIATWLSSASHPSEGCMTR